MVDPHDGFKPATIRYRIGRTSPPALPRLPFAPLSSSLIFDFRRSVERAWPNTVHALLALATSCCSNTTTPPPPLRAQKFLLGRLLQDQVIHRQICHGSFQVPVLLLETP